MQIFPTDANSGRKYFEQYVALAANDAALLSEMDYTIAEAIARFGRRMDGYAGRAMAVPWKSPKIQSSRRGEWRCKLELTPSA